jgi:hypothetical protein
LVSPPTRGYFKTTHMEETDDVKNNASNGNVVSVMIFDFIEKHYKPSDEKNADTYISTTDLKLKLEEHLGVEIDQETLFKLLEKKGYTFFDIGQMEFVWTLKKVDHPGNEG